MKNQKKIRGMNFSAGLRIDNIKLSIAMARAQLNNKELAEKAGISTSALSEARRYVGGSRLATVGKLAAALGVDVTEIIVIEPTEVAA